MSDIIDGLKTMDTSTLAILGFAAILLIFLLVLIIVTIRVLKSDYIDDEEPSKETPIPDEDDEEYYDDDEDEEDEDDDETSRKIREAVESVEVTKAKYEAEKIAQELEEAENQEKDKARINAAARVEAIANAVHEKNEASDEDEDDDYEDDYEEAPAEVSEETEDLEEEYSQDDGEEPDPDDAETNELDTDKIKAELRKERDAVKESESELNEMAKQRAEAPEYNASFDSAFVDRPVYEEKVDPVIPNPTPESILGAAPGPNPELLQGTPAMETPVADAPVAPATPVAPAPVVSDIDTPLPPKKKKKKKKTRDIDKEIDKEEKKEKRVPRPAVPMSDGKVAKFFWYNQQDVEGLERKEDMYFKSHYFNEADEVILDLITEMYDCGFVRTEELQRIAYGITFKSLGMKEILRSSETLGFNKESATKEPTEADKQEAYEKWCKYVDSFMEIIVINAPDEVRDYIIDQMYDYGHRDIEELMYSPY